MIIRVLQEAKHQVWLARREVRRAPERLRVQLRRRLAARVPYAYRPERYVNQLGDISVPNSGTFLINHLAFTPNGSLPDPTEAIPPRIFCLWTGENDMPAARKGALDSIRRLNPELDVVLVHPGNLGEWLVDDAPLPACYEQLSLVHRSDVLRAYLLAHHGGVYADLKPHVVSFQPLRERINAAPWAWGGGPAEGSAWNASPATGPLGRDQRNPFFRTPYQFSLMFRPDSPITREWWEEVERRVAYFSTLLEKHPAIDPYGAEGSYPVPWNALYGAVLAPLSLKHVDHLLVDPREYVDLSRGYR